MRLKQLIYAAGLAALSTALSNDCQAQYRGYGGGSSSINGPTVSPYLNLLQNNQNNVPLYQTLVRPQLEAREAIARQDISLQQLQSQLRGGNYQSGSRGTGSNVRRTGHTTYFGNYSHYYREIQRPVAPY